MVGANLNLNLITGTNCQSETTEVSIIDLDGNSEDLFLRKLMEKKTSIFRQKYQLGQITKQNLL